MDWLLDQLAKEGAMIRQTPLLAIFALLICFALMFLLNRWIYGERIDRAAQPMAFYKEESTIARKSPKEIEELADAWESAEKITVSGKTFVNQEVPLDGYSYEGCTFRNVTFVFNGDAPFGLVRNSIAGVYIKTANPRLNGLLRLLVELKMIDPKVRIDSN